MRTHGKTKTPEFKAWQAMMQRCYNPLCPMFKDYGGRGISVDPEWIVDPSVFLIDMGIRPTPKHSLHRSNNSEGYSKSNCCWATKTEQARERRSSVRVNFKGEVKTLSQWSEDFGIPRHVVWKRIQRLKWPVERALTETIRKW